MVFSADLARSQVLLVSDSFFSPSGHGVLGLKSLLFIGWSPCYLRKKPNTKRNIFCGLTKGKWKDGTIYEWMDGWMLMFNKVLLLLMGTWENSSLDVPYCTFLWWFTKYFISSEGFVILWISSSTSCINFIFLWRKHVFLFSNILCPSFLYFLECSHELRCDWMPTLTSIKTDTSYESS